MAAQHQPPSVAPDDLAVQAMHNFASCVADTTPRGAEHVLALDYRSPEYAKTMNRLSSGHADSRCLAGRMKFDTRLLAGGMAERLLVEKLDAARFAQAVAYDAAKPPIEARNPSEVTAICVIRAEPAKAWAILQSEPTSKNELSAMQAISPAVVGCVPQGAKLALNKPGLRAMLALAAYRLTQPAPVVAADGKPVYQQPMN
jgi:hypothetical protein